MSRTTTTARSSPPRSTAGRRGGAAASKSRALGLDQEKRFIGIQTAVADVFGLVSFTFREEISRPYQLEAELASLDGNVDFDRVIGQPAVVRIDTGPRTRRYIHGWVSRLDQMAPSRRFARYRLMLVPWLWFLGRSADCRIYQGMSVPKIVEDVFKRHGFGDFEWRTSARYEDWEYCVQYRETAFNFVSRLLEQEGIYYYFRHEASKHTLILCDGPNAHDCEWGYEKYEYQPGTEGEQGTEALHDWRVAREVQTTTYEHTDFDFTEPKKLLKSRYKVRRRHGRSDLAFFDYPGEYDERPGGQTWAQVRLEEMQARLQVAEGEGTLRGVAVGACFELKGFPRRDQCRKHLVLAATHSASAGRFESESQEEAGELHFRTAFRALDASVNFRPSRRTPKPVVQGVQTAVVVGRAGEEIHVDEFARVKVHFHWDRHHPSDESASCWIRVSQPWAGKGYGAMNIPRVGCEVIVDFLEGDPDQPIITGRVYNKDTMPHSSNAGRDGKPGNAPPGSIPEAAMMTSFKSNSLGGSGGANEITMNDEGGKEGLFLKAQKDEIHKVGNDREDTVGNNETRKVGVDRSREVGNDETVKIGVNRDKTVGSNEAEKIGANKTITVGGNHTENIAKNMTLTVALNKAETIGIASAETVGATKALTVGAAYQVSVGGLMNESVGAAKMVQVALSSSETVGETSSLKAKKVTITAEEEIAIKVGSAQMTMKKNGDITIKGNNIKIKGTKIEQN